MERPTIIIQGRLHKNSLSALPEYSKFANIIISCWDYDNLLLLKKYNAIIYCQKIIINKEPENLSGPKEASFMGAFPGSPSLIYNRGNSYKQVFSTLSGLENSTTDLTVKLRSDEFFSNIDFLLDFLIKNGDKKIVCSDICTPSFYALNYAIGDHYIGGKTKTLLKSFRYLKDKMEKFSLKDKNSWFHRGGKSMRKKTRFIPTESIICQSILNSLGHIDLSSLSHDEGRKIMRKYFCIFPHTKFKRCKYKDYDLIPEPPFDSKHHIDNMAKV